VFVFGDHALALDIVLGTTMVVQTTRLFMHLVTN
jgi:hypothetical protein